MHVKTDLQRLFFGGKQLEDCYTIYDYNIKLNDVIQLLKRITDIENEPTTSSKIVEKQKKTSKSKLQKKLVEEQVIKEQPLKKQVTPKKVEENAESLYYKVNDAIDCLDKEHSVWFEATIQKILKEGEEILYNVLWEFDNEAIPFIVPETYIRPRARHKIQVSKLSIGQKVMINYNMEEPEDIGLWYDFTVTEIKQDGKLTGIFHMEKYVFFTWFLDFITVLFDCLRGIHILYKNNFFLYSSFCCILHFCVFIFFKSVINLKWTISYLKETSI